MSEMPPERMPERPERAPDSPNIRKWRGRILSWGFMPALVIGLVVVVVGPELQQLMTALGAGIALLVGVPIVIYVQRLRRDNTARFEAARAEAAETGGRVRKEETAEGDFVYRVEPVDDIAPIDWDEVLAEGEGESGEEDAS